MPSSSHTLSWLFFLHYVPRSTAQVGLSSWVRELGTGPGQKKVQETVLFCWNLLTQQIQAASQRGFDFSTVLLECGGLPAFSPFIPPLRQRPRQSQLSRAIRGHESRPAPQPGSSPSPGAF